MVQAPKAEYRGNMLQLKDTAVHMTVPVSNRTASPITSIRVQLTSISLYTKVVLTNPYIPTNDKGNSNVSADCMPDPSSVNVVKS